MLDRIDIRYFELAVGSYIKSQSESDISAYCPVCGDSKTKRKARLHLYKSGTVTNVNCFNGGCPVNNRTVFSFLRDFYPALLEPYKKETFSTRMTNLSSQDNAFSGIKQTIHAEIETISLEQVFDELSQDAISFLEKRNITYDEKKFGKWFFSKENLILDNETLNIANSIIIPLYYKSKMYGFYSRRIDKKQFYTFIWKNSGYKVWNFFGIDNTKPVYIFEGIFDAISSGLDNIIACMGAKINVERLNDIKFPVFVLDNDKTGIENSLQYAKNGYSVYVQPNNYPEKDINELSMTVKSVDKVIKDNIYNGIMASIKIKQKL